MPYVRECKTAKLTDFSGATLVDSEDGLVNLSSKGNSHDSKDIDDLEIDTEHVCQEDDMEEIDLNSPEEEELRPILKHEER